MTFTLPVPCGLLLAEQSVLPVGPANPTAVTQLSEFPLDGVFWTVFLLQVESFSVSGIFHMCN